MKDRIRALGMVSGGLDSMLAVKTILDQDIDVIAISFKSLFFGIDGDEKPGDLKTVHDYLISQGAEVRIVDLSDSYLGVLHNPQSGYGRNVNPCIDCHALMFKTAASMMKELEAQFVFTGEVLGQRPKSQQFQELKLIARRCGLQDRLLRPLSAKLLEATLPEREGWIDREKLHSFQGRTRKPQIKLAERLGITDFPQPAGGCMLTDPGYSKKVKDLWMYREKSSLTWRDYQLLLHGRHLRISDRCKVIVGRHEEDNKRLEAFTDGNIKIELSDHPGPLVILIGDESEANIRRAAGIAARYSKVRESEEAVSVTIEKDGEINTISILPLKDEEVRDWVIN